MHPIWELIIWRDYFQKIRLWKLSSLNFCWSEILKRSDCVQASTYLFFLGIYTFQDVISASNPSKILWSNLLWNRNRIFIPLRYSQWKTISPDIFKIENQNTTPNVFGSILPSKGWFTNFRKKTLDDTNTRYNMIQSTVHEIWKVKWQKIRFTFMHYTVLYHDQLQLNCVVRLYHFSKTMKCLTYLYCKT